MESRRNYAAHYDGSKPSPVTVVSFGANTVGDHAWATNFNKKINARNILFAGDLLARVSTLELERGARLGADVRTAAMRAAESIERNSAQCSSQPH